MAEQKKRRQIDDIHDRKHQEIAALFSGTAVRYGFIGDQAGHGGDQCPQPSQIDADDQLPVVVREPGEQQGSGYIADHLAGDHCSHSFSSCNDIGQHSADRRDPSEISRKNEKSDKSKQQGIIYLDQELFLQEENNDQDDCTQDPERKDPKDHQKREDEEEAVNGYTGFIGSIRFGGGGQGGFGEPLVFI